MVNVLKKWGKTNRNSLYLVGISSTKLIELHKSLGVTPDIRRNQLRRLLNSKKYSRFLDIHGLSALIVEKLNLRKMI